MEFIPEKINKLVKGFGLDTIHYTDIFYSLGAIVLVFGIELFFVGWQQSSLKRLKNFDMSMRTDIVSCLLSIFNFYNILAFIFSFGICYYLVGLLQKSLDLKLILYIDNYYLQAAIILIVSDFKEYIRHFIFHKVQPLWKLHEFHHAGTNLNIITNYRGHFLEIALIKFFDAIPYVILGAPIQTYIVITSFVEVHHLLVHSSIKSDWGFIGKYILVSPDAHKIHHSTKSEHFNKNIGAVLIIWDKLFGTFHPSENIEEVGIPDNPYNKNGYVKDILICVKRFVGYFIKDIKLLFKSFYA